MGEIMASLARSLLYLGIPFVLMVFYSQWKWAKVCDENIQVLVSQKSGGGSFMLSPKNGGEVSIKNPKDGVTRTWAVNELATIDVTYPGVAFVPKFMQKQIRLAIVNEGDWEPMLNRSPHRERIASPDVVEFLQEIAEQSSLEIKRQIEDVVGTLATGPTRELIADPAVLGGLKISTVMQALAQVTNDLMDDIKELKAKIGKALGPNPTIVYVGLFVLIGLSVYLAFQATTSAQAVADQAEQINLIKNALGVR